MAKETIDLSQTAKFAQTTKKKKLDFLDLDTSINNPSETLHTTTYVKPKRTTNNLARVPGKPGHMTIWLSVEAIALEQELQEMYAQKGLKYNRSEIFRIGLENEILNTKKEKYEN
ncbi:hypothetical protein [Williamsoniiplasma lucivorax]|uniref:Uncharacterized protein n=1 Tax=Williamsoniiplasma lucivorax TaxID=209274 RepID=A0A2S5RFG2_9MOLU|nr:hypothetical protein [Williamsoniiplasma lucivorax]PPE05952.1 hypothetical protein ELUCI_v1c02430 [Williamsoniiplasma lucivorax]